MKRIVKNAIINLIEKFNALEFLQEIVKLTE